MVQLIFLAARKTENYTNVAKWLNKAIKTWYWHFFQSVGLSDESSEKTLWENEIR